MNKHSLEMEQIQMRRVVVFSNSCVKREKMCKKSRAGVKLVFLQILKESCGEVKEKFFYYPMHFIHEVCEVLHNHFFEQIRRNTMCKSKTDTVFEWQNFA